MALRFEVEHVRGVTISADELLEDLRRCGEMQADRILTQARYVSVGKYDPTTFKRRFGSWNNAVEAAGFEAGNTVNYSDEVLFENLMRLLEHRGRQPRLSKLASHPSEISHGPYRRRFRTWIAALHEFAAFANAADSSPVKYEEKIATKKDAKNPFFAVEVSSSQER